MPDLRSGPLQYALNCADNNDGPACGEEARNLLYEHRWELHDALDTIESLKIELGLYSLSTRDAARIIPTLVHEIREGTVNGSLLLRAVQAEQALAKANGEAP